tara:strand:+ start:1003 stop:1866 length:864 start_codon:yes stop_codon:yes gene_type:complete
MHSTIAAFVRNRCEFVDDASSVSAARSFLIVRGLLVAAERRPALAIARVCVEHAATRRIAEFVHVSSPIELEVDVLERATAEGSQGRTLRAMLRGRKVWAVLRTTERDVTSAVVGVPAHSRVVRIALASYLGDPEREMMVEAVNDCGVVGDVIAPWRSYGSCLGLLNAAARGRGRRGAPPAAASSSTTKRPSLSMTLVPAQKPGAHTAEMVYLPPHLGSSRRVAAEEAGPEGSRSSSSSALVTRFKISFRQRKGPSKSAGVAAFKVFGFATPVFKRYTRRGGVGGRY